MSERLAHLLQEQRKRRASRDLRSWPANERRLLERCHPRQRALATDTHRRIVALVPRRGGKTTAVEVRATRLLQRVFQGRFLYIATTRSHAEELLWQPLKELNERLSLGWKFNESKLIVRQPKTGATVRLVGADDKREIEKQRGKKFHEVWIDEAASHPTQLLDALLFRIIGPALSDFAGTLGLVGTPGHILAGPFYEASRPGSEISRHYDRRDDPEYADWDLWSLHTWTLQDNDRVHRSSCPADCEVNHLWEEALREKRANGWSDQHPIWRREYLGQWAADDTENVYKYRPHLDDGLQWNQWDPERRFVEGVPGSFAVLPKLPKGQEWQVTFGMDLGHSDPFALEVWAYTPTCKDLLHLYEFNRKGMYARPIAELLLGKEYVARVLAGKEAGEPAGVIGVTGWPIGMVADTAGLGDALLADLAEYGLHIEAAEKKDKHDAIELFNGDLVDGRVKVLKGSKLEEQLLHLQWSVDDFGKLKENKGQRNDAADAGLYGRRKALHKFVEQPQVPRPPKGTPEAANLEMAELEERMERRDEFAADLFGGDDGYEDLFGNG